jgi:outer membrane protein insertion porin family
MARSKASCRRKRAASFSFISSSGSYKQDAFDRDVQLINYLYFNEGYVQIKVDRPQVYVTPDKKGIYITIRVEEGERYKVGSIDFAGDLLFPRSELEEATEIDGTGWYQHETLLKDIRTIQAKYGDLGYAYANIIPRTRPRDKDRELDITFEIDKGNKVYFGRISVVGNSKTRDKVVRRELLVQEGELYNETRKRESLDNVKRLGFFDEVNFNSVDTFRKPRPHEHRYRRERAKHGIDSGWCGLFDVLKLHFQRSSEPDQFDGSWPALGCVGRHV